MYDLFVIFQITSFIYLSNKVRSKYLFSKLFIGDIVSKIPLTPSQEFRICTDVWKRMEAKKALYYLDHFYCHNTVSKKFLFPKTPWDGLEIYCHNWYKTMLLTTVRH